MSDFKTRLIAERDETRDKEIKLVTFLESDNAKDIDDVQLTLLKIQSNAMTTYVSCLNARLERL